MLEFVEKVPTWAWGVVGGVVLLSILLGNKSNTGSTQRSTLTVIYPYSSEYLQYASQSQQAYLNYLIAVANAKKEIEVQKLQSETEKYKADKEAEVESLKANLSYEAYKIQSQSEVEETRELARAMIELTRLEQETARMQSEYEYRSRQAQANSNALASFLGFLGTVAGFFI